jgi:hypothetical protein
MSILFNKKYSQIEFKPGSLSKAFKSVFLLMGLQGTGALRFKANYRIGDCGWEERQLSIDEIGSITSINDTPRELSFGYNWGALRIDTITFHAWHHGLTLLVGTDTAEKAQQIVKSLERDLHLETNVTDTPSGDIKADAQANRLSAIEDDETSGGKPVCFISYRFDELSQRYVKELSRFLELSDAIVIDGSSYEPRKISEKVMDRLSGRVDLLIYLITANGESAWTRDEMALSLGRGVRIVPVVENGSELKSGLLGDWEYIRFTENHICESFIKVLEALKFIEKEKAAQRTKGSTGMHNNSLKPTP